MNNVNLKKYNTYKLDCVAKELIIPKDVNEVISFLKHAKDNNVKYKIIGGGSNVIFKNKEYDGTILKLDGLDKLEIDGNEVTVGAGVNVIKMVLTLANNNLGGLEFASLLPGTIGGAIYNNAGAYGQEFSDVVTEVTVINPNLEVETFKEYSHGYRTSFFKENNDYIIIEAKIKVMPMEKEKILNIIQARKEARINSQPLNYPSAGSVFRNPEGNFAGKLIEEVGLKGFSIGDAKISEKHANFIVNTGNATGEDITKLIQKIQNEVKEKYDVDLVLEQEIIE